jgi:hypothetical protein
VPTTCPGDGQTGSLTDNQDQAGHAGRAVYPLDTLVPKLNMNLGNDQFQVS